MIGQFFKKQKEKKNTENAPRSCSPPHSITSLGATVTSCKGISWLPTWSWPPVVWRMSVVPSEVMTASAVGGDVTGMPFLFWWVFICLARWSLRMNLLEHSMHTNFFSPGRHRGTSAPAASHHLLHKQFSFYLTPVEDGLYCLYQNWPPDGALRVINGENDIYFYCTISYRRRRVSSHLCVFSGVSAAHHSWWISFRRTSSCRRRVSLRCASEGGPGGETSSRTPCHSQQCGIYAASSSPYPNPCETWGNERWASMFSVNLNVLVVLFLPSARLFAVGAGAGHPA